jgi:hypothetical protein
MIEFSELSAGKCRYPHGTRAPYLFCGESTTARSPYCRKHHRLCQDGDGKPWEALAGMINAVDKSVLVHRGAPSEAEPAVDEMVKGEGA